jgi:uncharacterized protein YggE
MSLTSRILLSASFLIPAFAVAQTPDPCLTAPTTCATLINTHATSRTRIPNTVVDISLSIILSDKDLPTVQRTLGEKSTALLTYLRSQQVQRLITSVVSYEPQTKFKDNGPNKTVGYNGTVRISFRTTPDKTPTLVTGALASGATAIDQTNFTPTEEEIAAARRALAADATRTAMAQAENVARAASLHVISVRNIALDSDSGLSYEPRAGLVMNSLFDADKRKDSSSPQIQTESGDASLSITVDVTVAATRQPLT